MKVLFFTAPWCAACRGIKPHVVSACNEFGVECIVIDTDADTAAGIGYNISSLPTIVIEDDVGNILDRVTQAIGKYDLIKRLKDARSGE